MLAIFTAGTIQKYYLYMKVCMCVTEMTHEEGKRFFKQKGPEQHLLWKSAKNILKNEFIKL